MSAEALEARCLLASPEIDLTFGRGGVIPLDFFGEQHVLRQLPNGKFVAAGEASTGDPLVARFNADGLLDTSFDGDGVLRIEKEDGFDRIVDAAIAPSGKIVILRIDRSDTQLYRFNVDGTIDTGFGTGGVLSLGVGGAMEARALAVQADGKFVLSFVKERVGISNLGYVVRLSADGTVDTAFRGGFAQAAPIPSGVIVSSFAIAGDGRIAFAGALRFGDDSQSFIGWLNGADGSLDRTYGDAGFAMVADASITYDDSSGIRSASAFTDGIAIDPLGRVVAMSQYTPAPRARSNTVTRFTTAGVRDATFGGGDGWVELPARRFGEPGTTPLFGAGGKIIVAGEPPADEDGVTGSSIFRLNPDGTLDSSFGIGGEVRAPRDPVIPHVAALDAAGNILLGGELRTHVGEFESRRLALTRFVSASQFIYRNAEGTLFVDGTDGNDSISLTRGTGDNVTLRRNGKATTFTGVTKLVFYSYAGDDTVIVPFALDCDLFATSGAKTFTLGDGNMNIEAGDASATITAGDGKHVIRIGGSGNSLITVGAGVDSIFTGAGNDTITTGDGADLIESGDGDDAIVTADADDTIYTGNGNDEVAAGAGDDVVQGRESQIPFDSFEPSLDPDADGRDGRKLYFGETGNDLLVGGSESSTLIGGDGTDALYTNAGEDSILAGLGNDFVEAGYGPDTIRGGDGNDRLYGEHSYDSATVGDADLIIGGDGDDTLRGAGDDDTLDGGAGVDLLDGGAGNNLLDTPITNITVVDGVLTFEGTDADEQLIIAPDASGVAVRLDGNLQNFQNVRSVVLRGNGGNDLLQVEPILFIYATLSGGAGNDTLGGARIDDHLDGGSGDDSLVGYDGRDILIGGDGNDTLEGDAGPDFFDGGLGSDVISGGASGDTLDYSSRTGNLIVGLDNFQDDGEAGERDFVFPDIEAVMGGSGNDILGGGPGESYLYGNDGNDTLSGGDGPDGLFGAGGNDRLDGGADNDTLEAGAGHDVLGGGDGFDVLYGYAGNDVLLAADNGRDYVRGGPGFDTGETDPTDDVAEVESSA